MSLFFIGDGGREAMA